MNFLCGLFPISLFGAHNVGLVTGQMLSIDHTQKQKDESFFELQVVPIIFVNNLQYD